MNYQLIINTKYQTLKIDINLLNNINFNYENLFFKKATFLIDEKGLKMKRKNISASFISLFRCFRLFNENKQIDS